MSTRGMSHYDPMTDIPTGGLEGRARRQPLAPPGQGSRGHLALRPGVGPLPHDHFGGSESPRRAAS
jgi:hypothetical protein